MNGSRADAVFLLKAVARAEPDALAGILQVLQVLNVVPLRVVAQRGFVRGRKPEVLEIEIELPASELQLPALHIVAAQIDRLPVVLTIVVSAPGSNSLQ